MGKQKRNQKNRPERAESANAIDWEIRVRELVRAGVLSPLCLDRGHDRQRPGERRQ